MARDTDHEEREKRMFATDSFVNAEVTYRGERIRKDWGTFGRRASRAARRAARTATTDA